MHEPDLWLRHSLNSALSLADGSGKYCRMPHLPDFETFSRLAAGHQLVPVYRRMLSDALTPVTAFALLEQSGTAGQASRGTPACLFESVVGGEKVGRYSFLGIEPFWELIARGRRVTVRGEGGTREFQSADPLDELRKRLAAFKAVHLPELPPFEGGAIGYAGYDVVRYVEHLPHAPRDDRGLPDLSFALYDRMVVFDNVSKTHVRDRDGPARSDDGDARAAYDDACRRVDDLVDSPVAAGEAAAGRHRDDRLANDRLEVELSAGANLKTPCASASSTSGPATSFRSCSASGSRSI